MRPRFSRAFPWLFATATGVLLLLGAAWDASFNSTPTDATLANQIDDYIRATRQETYNRMIHETCFGTATTTGCPSSGDNGFLREGAARAFFATTAPTALNDAAATALGTGHDGRIWVDSDGADNVASNNDDNQINFYTGSAWAAPRWESFGGIALSGLASGDILKYNGTNLVNTKVSTLSTNSVSGSGESNITFTNGTCTVDCSTTDFIDAGAGTPLTTSVTVPSTPSGVVWDIWTSMYIPYAFTSSNSGYVICTLNVSTGGAYSAVWSAGGRFGNNNGDSRVCQRSDRAVAAATAGTTYSFRMSMTDPDGTADWDANSSTAPAALSEARLVVEVRPRTIF